MLTCFVCYFISSQIEHLGRELEIRFDMDPLVAGRSLDEPLPVNWALKFIHNQLFKHVEYPSRFNHEKKRWNNRIPMSMHCFLFICHKNIQRKYLF